MAQLAARLGILEVVSAYWRVRLDPREIRGQLAVGPKVS